MKKIKDYLSRFFNNVESVNTQPTQTESVNGKAFEYRTYRLSSVFNVMPGDTLHATIRDVDRTTGKLKEETVQEIVEQTSTVDTVAVFRAKEAFGMTNVIGAAFGKSKTTR